MDEACQEKIRKWWPKERGGSTFMVVLFSDWMCHGNTLDFQSAPYCDGAAPFEPKQRECSLFSPSSRGETRNGRNGLCFRPRMEDRGKGEITRSNRERGTAGISERTREKERNFSRPCETFRVKEFSCSVSPLSRRMGRVAADGLQVYRLKNDSTKSFSIIGFDSFGEYGIIPGLVCFKFCIFVDENCTFLYRTSR